MKTLNFKPAKSKNDFRKNYHLHDISEFHGKNLLQQWGIDFSDFGSDRRYEKVWEKGLDKPDISGSFKNYNFLIDWKGKKKEEFWVNKRAIDSYKNWSIKLDLPVFIVFFVLSNNKIIKKRKIALIGLHNYKELDFKAWDKNKVVKFDNLLPDFTKLNIWKLLSKYPTFNNNNQ